jgi:hypothetical protein
MFVWAYEVQDDGGITPLVEPELSVPFEKIAEQGTGESNPQVKGQSDSEAPSGIDIQTFTYPDGQGLYANSISLPISEDELLFGTGMGPYRFKTGLAEAKRMGYPEKAQIYFGVSATKAFSNYSMGERSEPSKGSCEVNFSPTFLASCFFGVDRIALNAPYVTESGFSITTESNLCTLDVDSAVKDVFSFVPINPHDGSDRTHWQHQHSAFSVSSEYLDRLTYVTTGNTLYVTIGSNLLSFKGKAESKQYGDNATDEFRLVMSRTNIHTDGPLYSGVQVAANKDNDNYDAGKGVQLWGEDSTQLKRDYGGGSQTLNQNINFLYWPFIYPQSQWNHKNFSYRMAGYSYARTINIFRPTGSPNYTPLNFIPPASNAKPPLSFENNIGTLILKYIGDGETPLSNVNEDSHSWMKINAIPETKRRIDLFDDGTPQFNFDVTEGYDQNYFSSSNLSVRQDLIHEGGIVTRPFGDNSVAPPTGNTEAASKIYQEWAFGSIFDSMNYGILYSLYGMFNIGDSNSWDYVRALTMNPFFNRNTHGYGMPAYWYDRAETANASNVDFLKQHILWNPSSSVNAMTFFQGRLVVSGGHYPSYACFSSSDFEPKPRFIPISDTGVWTSDKYPSGAFVFDAKGFNESESEITGFIEIEDDLLMFTPDRVFKMSTAQQSGGFSVLSAYIRPLNKFGASRAGFVNLEDTGVYVSADGKRLYRIELGGEEESYKTEDMTVYADHIVKTRISHLTATTIPFPSVWALTEPTASDSTAKSEIINLTVMRGESVRGTSRHIIAGANGDVPLDACTIQSSDGDPITFFAVKRTVNGSEKWYIESMKTGVDVNRELGEQEHLDCRVTYDSGASSIDQVPANTFIALAGHTVAIWNQPNDGSSPSYLGTKTITATGIFDSVLSASVDGKITVGLKYTSVLRTLPQDLDMNTGSTSQELRALKSVSIDVMKSYGGKFAYVNENREDSSTLDSIPYSTSTPSLLSESVHCEIDSDTDRRGAVLIKTDDPYPLDINQIVYTTDYSTRGGPNR